MDNKDSETATARQSNLSAGTIGINTTSNMNKEAPAASCKQQSDDLVIVLHVEEGKLPDKWDFLAYSVSF